MKSREITAGPIVKPLLKFFFPILIGSFFQQLYNTADALIVGNVLGKEALAAVGGITGTYLNTYIGFFVGLSAGATVLIAQFYGSGDNEKITKTIHTALTIGIILSIALTVLGILTARESLIFLKQPAALLELSLRYIKIFFTGLIFLLLYNMGCSILRASGDSKRPLYFLIVSCLINIVLDVLLVKYLHFGIEGAAVATVISQAAAAFLVLYSLIKNDGALHLDFAKLGIDVTILKRIFIIGLPAAIESLLYAASNLIIGSKINTFSVDVIAAYTAYGKIDAVFWLVMQAFNIALTTFVGQNFGARKYKRVKKATVYSLLLALASAIFMSITVVTFAPFLIGFFNHDPAVIKPGVLITLAIAPYWFCYIPISIIPGTLVGMGNSYIPTVVSAEGIIGLRTLWVTFLKDLTIQRLFFVYPLSWAFTSLIFLIYYFGGFYKRQVKSADEAL